MGVGVEVFPSQEILMAERLGGSFYESVECMVASTYSPT